MSESVFDMYNDNRGDWRWKLKSSNGQVTANSGQGYKEKKSCEDSIASAKKNISIAKMWKQMSKRKDALPFF